MEKLESVWHGFLRRMVKGGFKRKNAPKNKNDTSIPAEDIDWSFVLSNELIIEIIGFTASRASLLARRNNSGEAVPAGNPEHSIRSHRAVNANFNSPVAFILNFGEN